MKKTNNYKPSNHLYILFFILSLFLVAGVSYAFYTAFFSGESSQVSFKSKDIRISYQDGQSISIQSALPGNNDGDNTKHISITNTGNGNANYSIFLADIDNEGLTGLYYTITSTNSDATSITTKTPLPLDDDEHILLTERIPVGVTYTYEIAFYYEDTELDQTDEMGLSFNAKIQVK